MEAFQIVHRNPDSCARTRSTSLSLLAPLPSAIHFSLFVPSSRTRGHVFFFLSLTLRFFSRFRHAPPAPPESAAAHTTDTEPSVETTQPGIKGGRAATEKIRKKKLVFFPAISYASSFWTLTKVGAPRRVLFLRAGCAWPLQISLLSELRSSMFCLLFFGRSEPHLPFTAAFPDGDQLGFRDK